ncbi:MAG: transglutaminase domain-containing protein [Ignavibacteriales bacterium]|nr:transglutaminase domain-containing protein [Ignavibacteriales bacterium]
MSIPFKESEKIRVLFTFVLFAFFTKLSFSQSPDFLYKSCIDITIAEPKQNEFRVTSITRNEVDYISKRSTDKMSYTIPSSYISKISKINYVFDENNYDLSDVKYDSPSEADDFITDDIIYRIELARAPKIGDKFRYAYQTDYVSEKFFSSITIPKIDSIVSFKVSIYHSDSVKVAFTIIPSRSDIAYTIDSSDSEKTVLMVKNIQYETSLDHYNANNSSGEIVFSLKKNGKEILPVTPRGITEWYAGLTPLQPRLDSADKKILYDTIRQQSNDLSKIKIIYDYVRLNFRYAFEKKKFSGLVPRKPSEILASKFADCKERATLIMAIAAEHSLPVYYVLFPDNESIKSGHTYPWKFNHVLNVYASSSETVFFDATSKNCPFGILPEMEIDENVLVLDPENPRWVTLQETSPKPSVVFYITAKMDSLRFGTGNIILTRQEIIAYNSLKKQQTGSLFENTLSRYLTNGLNKVRIIDIKEISSNEDSIVLTAKFDLSAFIISTSKSHFAPQTAFSLWNADILNRKTDKYPIVFLGRYNGSLIIDLQGTGLHTEAQELKIGDLDSLGLTAQAVQAAPNTIKLSYKISQYNRIVEGYSKTGFLNFYENYLKNKSNMFLLGENNAQKTITR